LVTIAKKKQPSTRAPAESRKREKGNHREIPKLKKKRLREGKRYQRKKRWPRK